MKQLWKGLAWLLVACLAFSSVALAQEPGIGAPYGTIEVPEQTDEETLTLQFFGEEGVSYTLYHKFRGVWREPVTQAVAKAAAGEWKDRFVGEFIVALGEGVNDFILREQGQPRDAEGGVRFSIRYPKEPEPTPTPTPKPTATPKPTPMPTPVPQEGGETAIDALNLFLSLWAKGDFEAMVRYALPAWREAQPDPVRQLSWNHSGWLLDGWSAEPASEQPDVAGESIVLEVTADLIKNTSAKEKMTCLYSALVSREEDGKWYVDPDSMRSGMDLTEGAASVAPVMTATDGEGQPTETPTEEPTQAPTETPTAEPTATATPTPEPTQAATPAPTVEPTPEPTPEPLMITFNTESAVIPLEPEIPAKPDESAATPVPAVDSPTAAPIQETVENAQTAAPVAEVVTPGVDEGTQRTLKLWMHGDDVRALQEQLKTNGYTIGRVDGVYGQRTERAVKRFQKAQELTEDGIVGAETRERLGEVLGIEIPLHFRASEEFPPGFERDLSLNKEGMDVYVLQVALAEKGYLKGKTDQVYGSKTRSAVIRFQKDNGLKADGVAGVETLRLLFPDGADTSSGN